MGDGEGLGRIEASWDRVTRDPEMTRFKRTLRDRQAHWRAEHGLDQGEHPPGKANGSVLATADGSADANFLSPAIARAVHHRLSRERREHRQQLDKVRLRTHLLSSMPMCFNLFGELHQDRDRLTLAGQIWGINQPGHDVRFEWSPGRGDPQYTGDGTAFDVALFFGEPNGPQHVIGIETKYHEHAVSEAAPNETSRLPRYREIVDRSAIFTADWEKRILGTPQQQIWRDHLLLLALLQHPSRTTHFGKYVLVYPAGNTSFRRAAAVYREALTDHSTFDVATVEDLLDAHVLHEAATELLFRERYIPEE